jgi:hypothetical protein
MFIRQINESMSDNEKSDNHDAEKDRAIWKRELELLSEQEIMHQDAGPDWRSNEEEPLELRNVLATALSLKDIEPQRLVIYADDTFDSMEDAETILAYNLSNPLIKGGDFIANEAMLNLKYVAPSQPDAERDITIHLKAERATEQALYFRITIAIVPLSIDSTVPFDSRENRPVICSFLTAFDLSSPKQRLDKFHYMWKEALELIKTHPEELTEEQQELLDLNQSKDDYYYTEGVRMALHQQYIQAIQLLEPYYLRASQRYGSDETVHLWHATRSAYYLALSYYHLGQLDKAFYYIHLVHHHGRIDAHYLYFKILFEKQGLE